MSTLDPEPALFLFDIDGTLIKGGTDVHRAAFAHAYRVVYGLPLDLDGVVAAGRTDSWLLAQPLRRHGLNEEQIREGIPAAFAEMDRYVETHLGDLRDRVLPGVPETLRRLHAAGQLIGLLTGNLAGIAWAKLRRAGLAFFDTGGFGEESEDRAHLVPVALRSASEAIGRRIPPSRTVVIGDTPLDVHAGKAGGTHTVGVATGPYSEDDLRAAGADLVLPSFVDVQGTVDQLLSLVSVTRPTGL